MSNKLHEPLPLAPFLAWCDTHEAAIRRELRAGAMTGESDAEHTRYRLVCDLGWPPEAGKRRMHRWRHENTTGHAERADIQDALEHAGVEFEDIYPHTEPPRERRMRLGEQRLMTDKQVIAAHTIYTRQRMTMTTLSELLWARFGYRTPGSCAKALCIAFRGLGLKRRQCTATRHDGQRCERPPNADSDTCAEHRDGIRPSHIGGRNFAARQTAAMWQPSADLIAQVRAMHTGGMPFRQIGEQLLPQTPLRSADHLAQRIAAIAARDGWHQTQHIRRPRVAA